MFSSIDTNNLGNDRWRADSNSAPAHHRHWIIGDDGTQNKDNSECQNWNPPCDSLVFYTNKKNCWQCDNQQTIRNCNLCFRFIYSINCPHQRATATLQKRWWRNALGRVLRKNANHLWPDEGNRSTSRKDAYDCGYWHFFTLVRQINTKLHIGSV